MSYKIGQLKTKLENYKDSTIVGGLLISQNLELDSVPKDNIEIEGYKIKIMTLSRDPRITTGRPERTKNGIKSQEFIFILDSMDKQILVDSFKSGIALNSYLSKYLSNLSSDKIQIEKAEFIDDKDIWVESISGFLFGDIETLSTSSKLVRLGHLILFYFLFLFVSKFVESNDWFEIKKS